MAMQPLDLATLAQRFQDREGEPILKLRRFAILALLTEKNGELSFVLNKRAAGVRQPGDICFPGGHQEAGETPRETALRETYEELGVPQESITIFGKSDYMLTIYRGIIQPFLGFVPYEILRSSCPNEDEVSQIFTVPLSFFVETEPQVHDLIWEVAHSDTFPYDRIEGGEEYPFSKCLIPELFYEYKGHTIWGFTAQVIQNVISIMVDHK